VFKVNEVINHVFINTNILLEYYVISDNLIGVLSSSLFAGMTFGAFFWGSYSDANGRKVPYTMTLLITSIFGAISSFAFNFTSLCICLFFLGFGVGGNMPTDGKCVD
jgi:MFS family permease